MTTDEDAHRLLVDPEKRTAENRFAGIESDLRVLKWGQAVTFAMTVAIFAKLFIH